MFSSIRSRPTAAVRQAAAGTKQAVRTRTSRKTPRRPDPKIPVQLLKDFDNFGYRGEVIKVLPSVMRNYLHMGNGAAYITNEVGPRIPVVDKSDFRAQQAQLAQEKAAELALSKQRAAEKAAREEEIGKVGALSLDELSNLFQSMKNSGKRGKQQLSIQDKSTQQVVESSEITYTSLDISLDIPETFYVQLTDQITLPVTKELLAMQMYNMSGIDIPVSTITLGHEKEGEVKEINSSGKYILSLEIPGEREAVERIVIVQ